MCSHLFYFVLISQFWVCEKIPLINTISGRECFEPKFIKWDLQELHTAMSGIGFRTIKEVPNTPIGETRLLLTMNTSDAIDKENICPNDKLFESLKKSNSRKSFMKLLAPKAVAKDIEDGIHSTNGLKNERINYQVEVPATKYTSEEFDPSKMFQLFSSQDSIFNDDDEPVRNGEQNIEDKLKECEELLEKERLNVKVLKDEIIVLQREHTKNEDLKEEIKMLKLKLEIEEIKVIEYHEMLCEAQNSLKESTDHLRNVYPNNGHSLNFTTPPPTLGT